MKKRVGFLFGTGAELDFKMPKGDEYLKKTILLDERDKSSNYLEELNKFFNKKYFTTVDGTSYTYYKYILNNVTLKSHLIKNYKYYGIPEDLVDEVKSNKKTLAEAFSDERFKEYGSFAAGILDSYFHTVVNPVKLGKHRFSKVFNYYWACYFAIVEGILENVEDAKFAKYYENNTIQYSKIIDGIKAFTRKLYKDHHYFRKDNSYYHLIVKYLINNSLPCSGVITTNYFNFAEREFKSICEQFSYPNGKLCYFEFPEFLEVKNISKINNSDVNGDKLFFPFIFGQSYTKPIINHFQIEEFKILRSILDKSDCLIILGYNINEDDMHINAYLHDFININHVIFVTDRTKKDIEEDIRFRLRYPKNKNKDNLKICTVTYGNNQKVVEDIFMMLEDKDKKILKKTTSMKNKFKKIKI